MAVTIALVLPLLDKQSNSISNKECQPGTGASHVCDSYYRQRKSFLVIDRYQSHAGNSATSKNPSMSSADIILLNILNFNP